MLLTACPGWTWEYIDESMTLPRLNALTRHWTEFPPVHVSLAGIVKGLGGTTSNGKSKPARRGSPEIRSGQYSPREITTMEHTTRRGDKTSMPNGLDVTMIKRRSPVSAEELLKIEEEREWRERAN